MDYDVIFFDLRRRTPQSRLLRNLPMARAANSYWLEFSGKSGTDASPQKKTHTPTVSPITPSVMADTYYNFFERSA